MTKNIFAIRFHQTGDAAVLTGETLPLGAPAPGQAQVQHTAIGVNYIDTYHRTGLYPLPLPSAIGIEGVGMVTAIGEGVTEVAVGDKVAYSGGPLGAYSEARNMPARQLIKVPMGLDDQAVCAGFLRALTVEYLFFRAFALKGGETILFHAAAGGVGLIACQWARSLGVNMIGTVGSDEKAALAKAHGCAHVINYRSEDFVARVKDITAGKGVPVVYDSVGADTYPASLDCISPFGYFISYGNSSGPIKDFNLSALGPKGSIFATRQTLMTYIADRSRYQEMADRVFAMMQAGKLQLAPRQTYALKNAAQAHRDLEARKTVGGIVLLP
ncbi:MAG: quinone oxidoreductase, NADPH-dependent [Pseudomonadota bacterium]|jgi:NADPH2:quinone reductase